MTISYIRDFVAIYGHCDNFTTGGPVLKDNKMLHSCNFICATGALDTLQSSHISAKGGILVFRPTTVTWFRCKAAIFPPKAAYGFLDPLCSIIQMYEQWLEQWLIAIRFSRAGKGRRLADKRQTRDRQPHIWPINSFYVGLIPEVLVARRKSQRRYKQKTSIILKDNVSDKLDIFYHICFESQRRLQGIQ